MFFGNSLSFLSLQPWFFVNWFLIEKGFMVSLIALLVIIIFPTRNRLSVKCRDIFTPLKKFPHTVN